MVVMVQKIKRLREDLTALKQVKSKRKRKPVEDLLMDHNKVFDGYIFFF